MILTNSREIFKRNSSDVECNCFICAGIFIKIFTFQRAVSHEKGKKEKNKYLHPVFNIRFLKCAVKKLWTFLKAFLLGLLIVKHEENLLSSMFKGCICQEAVSHKASMGNHKCWLNSIEGQTNHYTYKQDI
jgi:hypothetical protein